jgi:hypothetical protein
MPGINSVRFQSELTVSCLVTDKRNGNQWSLTGVYRPQENLNGSLFERAEGPEPLSKSAWLVLGDFNLIYMDQDKSNDSLDKRMMARFRRTFT